MSGRIKIVGAEPIGEAVPLPAVPEADAFDIECGTFETAAFAADASPNRCPGQTFLCGGENTRFAQCMHAIDCKMREEVSRLSVCYLPYIFDGSNVCCEPRRLI